MPDQKRFLSLLILATSPLVGVALYVGVVAYTLGDPFGYVQVQSQGWQNQWIVPFARIAEGLTRSYALTQLQIPRLGEIIRAISTFGILALLIWGRDKCDPAFVLYVLVSIVFIHSQEPSRSTVRYELVLFPVFLLFAQLMSPHARLTRFVAPMLATMQLVLFTRHISWHWVA